MPTCTALNHNTAMLYINMVHNSFNYFYLYSVANVHIGVTVHSVYEHT
jgi:hypothetical protein